MVCILTHHISIPSHGLCPYRPYFDHPMFCVLTDHISILSPGLCPHHITKFNWLYLIMDNIFKKDRNSRMYLNEVYFWTSTIYQWKHLLKQNKYKQKIIDCLRYLSEKGKVKVYGFVIMPNHIHLLWEMIDVNGKELPHASFQKYTAHAIQADLRTNHPEMLTRFKVDEPQRSFRIWQRDPLAIHIQGEKMAVQKLEYIHFNPLQSHWNLCRDPEEYYYSSASFYEKGQSDFDFLTDFRERI